MKRTNIDINNAYDTTWISAKHSFPLQISHMSLISDYAAKLSLKIFQSKVFDINAEGVIDITNPVDGTMRQ